MSLNVNVFVRYRERERERGREKERPSSSEPPRHEGGEVLEPLEPILVGLPCGVGQSLLDGVSPLHVARLWSTVHRTEIDRMGQECKKTKRVAVSNVCFFWRGEGGGGSI